MDLWGSGVQNDQKLCTLVMYNYYIFWLGNPFQTHSAPVSPEYILRLGSAGNVCYIKIKSLSYNSYYLIFYDQKSDVQLHFGTGAAAECLVRGGKMPLCCASPVLKRSCKNVLPVLKKVAQSGGGGGGGGGTGNLTHFLLQPEKSCGKIYIKG